jgi:hypothetical protein
MSAEAEKAADLQNGNQLAILGDDDVIKRADLLVLLVMNGLAEEFRCLEAVCNGRYIDFDKRNRLSLSNLGGCGKGESGAR